MINFNVDFLGIIILVIFIYFIVYSAVSLAIRPLLVKEDDDIYEDSDLGLVKLRDMGIFSNEELEEAIEFYGSKDIKKGASAQYQKYEKVIHELMQIGYLTDEEYLYKVDKLKKYFKMDS
ncbi:MAG: hypothetical protein ACM3X7_07320 [Solirubrobacterales bacterium]